MLWIVVLPSLLQNIRAQLLRQRFRKRKTTREVVQQLQHEQEKQQQQQQQQEQQQQQQHVDAPKRYRVMEEYSFSGMGHIFDHHAPNAVTRVLFAHGDNTRCAMCCVDGEEPCQLCFTTHFTSHSSL
jgi:transcription initiation factor TFIID subunit TAF12